MSQNTLEDFGGYRKALQLFELVASDMETLEKRPVCWRLIGQQVASADSIAANIEEGWDLLYARGSARETRERYLRMRRWLDGIDLASRTALCDEIIGIITTTVARLREPPS